MFLINHFLINNYVMKFSVLMSIYYKENPDFFYKALDSVFNQTILPDEVIVVKDGNLTPELDSVLDYFCGKYVSILKIIPLKENVGLSTALNIGLSKCSNNYVARMDTDDLSLSHRFERQLNFMLENPHLDVVGSWAYLFDEKNDNKGILKMPVTDFKIRKYIWMSPFIHPSIMFKRDAIIGIGSYNSNSGLRQDDYELWFRCAYNGLKFANIPEMLIKYRFTEDNVKRNNYKVGLARFKVGFKWSRKLKCGSISYIGILIPLIRSLLPYPLNIYVYRWQKTMRDLITPNNRL